MPVRSFVLSSETLARLARVLPPEWTPGNPVDLHISASAELYAAALKVLSEAPEVDGILIIHTPNAMVGGVALNLENAEAVRLAAHGILRRVHESASEARIEGFAVQRMVLWPQVRQLMLGSARDPLFGPVLVFGEGGRAVELVRDHTVALVRLSALLVDHPEIVACDINPLFANHQGVLTLDARVRVSRPDDSDLRRFSILPYPAGLEEAAVLRDGSHVLLRPIRPEDEPAHGELIGRMTPQDLRYRFFGSTQKLQRG